MTVRIPIQLMPGAKAPEPASEEAAGYDLYAYHDAVIEPAATLLVSSGIRLAIPVGFEAQVRPRSGLSLRTRLRIANSPGTIDADYRGLVSIICENTHPLLDPLPILLAQPALLESFEANYRPQPLADYLKDRGMPPLPAQWGEKEIYLDRQGYPLGTIFIKAGERIAQLVFAKVSRADFIQVQDVSVIGQDRGGGFGSTGMI